MEFSLRPFGILATGLILSGVSSLALAAPCGSPTFSGSSSVHLSSSELLIVTHPSTVWDARFSSKRGMDAAVRFAKKNRIPVVYLQGPTEANTYFFNDCEPDYLVLSLGGEIGFNVPATHVYSVGGHWEACQAATLSGVIADWADQKPMSNLTITQILDGIYASGYYVFPSDPYRQSFLKFLDVVSFRGSDDTWVLRKLNMLELMAIIEDENLQIEHLKRGLPDVSGLPNHEVRLVLNGKLIEVLRPGIGPNAPVFTFEFTDSVTAL